MKKQILHYKKRDGVTLAEMMVAFGVFGIFISIALGGFMQSLQNQRVALVLMEANDAASIIFENITRQLRTANAKSRCVPLPANPTYCETRTIHTDTNKLWFYNYEKNLVTFDFTSEESRTISTSISIQSFQATVIESTTIGAPPRVVLTITLLINDPSIGEPVEKTLQTTVSPRLYYNLKEIQI